MARCIIASTSALHGRAPLDYFSDTIKNLFDSCREVLFIPYARPGGISHELYTEKIDKVFKNLDIHIRGIHTYEDPIKAIQEAEGYYTGGGNTFVLVKQLYQNKLMSILREHILSEKPYLGTSAGSNICGLTMQTTNDMPIVTPESLKTLGILPFNINPHYLDPNPDSRHNGESRETRIQEYHAYNSPPVIGLREGSWLECIHKKITLRGELPARIFEKGKSPYEIKTGTDLSNFN